MILLLGLAEGFRQVPFGLLGYMIQVAGLLLLWPGSDSEPFLALGTAETASFTDYLVNGPDNHILFSL